MGVPLGATTNLLFYLYPDMGIIRCRINAANWMIWSSLLIPATAVYGVGVNALEREDGVTWRHRSACSLSSLSPFLGTIRPVGCHQNQGGERD